MCSFHDGILTVSTSSERVSSQRRFGRFYGGKCKLSGVRSCPELDECTLMFNFFQIGYSNVILRVFNNLLISLVALLTLLLGNI